MIKELFNGLVLVEVDGNRVTDGGLYVPDDDSKDVKEGEVKIVADDLIEDINEGDRVIFNSINTEEIESNKYIVREEDVYGRTE